MIFDMFFLNFNQEFWRKQTNKINFKCIILCHLKNIGSFPPYENLIQKFESSDKSSI